MSQSLLVSSHCVVIIKATEFYIQINLLLLCLNFLYVCNHFESLFDVKVSDILSKFTRLYLSIVKHVLNDESQHLRAIALDPEHLIKLVHDLHYNLAWFRVPNLLIQNLYHLIHGDYGIQGIAHLMRHASVRHLLELLLCLGVVVEHLL